MRDLPPILALDSSPMTVETIEEGGYDVAAFAEELATALQNRAIGTSRLFENERIRVWEVRLAPGERTPFHAQRFGTSGHASMPASVASATRTGR